MAARGLLLLLLLQGTQAAPPQAAVEYWKLYNLIYFLFQSCVATEQVLGKADKASATAVNTSHVTELRPVLSDTVCPGRSMLLLLVGNFLRIFLM
ncbi:basic leucine zipper and W2 domain-containing protein 1 [Platysternon megacephalum]|uniref:Basic leucine zipper and W2 domain-containing protein 1 n=1 Tax=Platysternon megacephalum TaxID=55544 RepID=A0A4D9F2W0_9SAUR|nr:basic leucine zipper and W2 domain-containing protein 1 [Platysternon megacephalum]